MAQSIQGDNDSKPNRLTIAAGVTGGHVALSTRVTRAPDELTRTKILVGIDPEHKEVWYWLIPFSNGRCSLGVVAEPAFFTNYEGTNDEKLKTIVNESNDLRRILDKAVYDTPVNQIVGYSANVKSLHGNKFLLLGNAGEFLDPVFSSGVTIAMKSASMAARASGSPAARRAAR